MLSVASKLIMLNAVMLSVVMLNVMAPLVRPLCLYKKGFPTLTPALQRSHC